jgi:hypothetical protein
MHVVRADVHRESASKSRDLRLATGLSIAKDNPCLISGCGQRIHLGATFAVGSQHVERHAPMTGSTWRCHAAPQCTSAGTDVSRSGLTQPNTVREDERLPRLQLNRLACQRPLHVG